MKIPSVVMAALLIASQFPCRAYAIELCEPQDYYNLANAAKCPIKDISGNKDTSRDAMFEIMKNYPYEYKDAFVKLLEKKINLVDSYITQQQVLKRTEKVTAALNTLEHAKQVLLGQLESVNTATQYNWVSIRDQARRALEEISTSLREVE